MYFKMREKFWLLESMVYVDRKELMLKDKVVYGGGKTKQKGAM